MQEVISDPIGKKVAEFMSAGSRSGARSSFRPEFPPTHRGASECL